MRTRIPLVAATLLIPCAAFCPGDSAEPSAEASVQLAAVDPYMGEYAGVYVKDGQAELRAADADVIGRKNNSYVVVVTAGAAGKDKPAAEFRLEGKARPGRLPLSGSNGQWSGAIQGAAFRAASAETGEKLLLRRVLRRSPTEGLAPPEDAVVLLPYQRGGKSNLEKWQNQRWKLLDDGSMEVTRGDQRTKAELGSIRLHLEFRCPYEPDRRGQGRGNSGVYVQDRYEIQVLDSFGLEGRSNECGGIYKIAAPRVNAALPPARWQTYDVTFRAATFDEEAKVASPPRMTVLHNGIVIHEDLDIPHPTGGARGGGHVAKAPLRLQDHGHKVRYRNVWYVELPEEKPEASENDSDG